MRLQPAEYGRWPGCLLLNLRVGVIWHDELPFHGLVWLLLRSLCFVVKGNDTRIIGFRLDQLQINLALKTLK